VQARAGPAPARRGLAPTPNCPPPAQPTPSFLTGPRPPPPPAFRSWPLELSLLGRNCRHHTEALTAALLAAEAAAAEAAAKTTAAEAAQAAAPLPGP
jgi:hypothetical protein